MIGSGSLILGLVAPFHGEVCGWLLYKAYTYLAEEELGQKQRSGFASHLPAEVNAFSTKGRRS